MPSCVDRGNYKLYFNWCNCELTIRLFAGFRGITPCISPHHITQMVALHDPRTKQSLGVTSFAGPADGLYGLRRQNGAKRYQEWLSVQDGSIGELWFLPFGLGHKILPESIMCYCHISHIPTLVVRQTYMGHGFITVVCVNLLKPTGHVMHQQFNIQQLYVLSTLYLCVLYLSENKQRLVPLTA